MGLCAGTREPLPLSLNSTHAARSPPLPERGDDHFITFSCYAREPYLATTKAKDTFLDSLEQTRHKYNFDVLGYVVMPEHVHLLLGEPSDAPLSKALQSLKLSVSKLHLVPLT